MKSPVCKDRFLRVQLLLLFSGFQTALVFSTPPYPWGFPHSSISKESACNAGDLGLIPGSGRSPGEGNGNPLLYSCLKNPMDRGAWVATFHGVTRVRHNLVTKPPPPYPWASLVVQSVKNLPTMWRPGFDPWIGKIPWRMAWHPTPVFLPGESPWIEEPGGLQSTGLQGVGHN